MRILEIKNNLVKISYEVSENLALSGFIIVEDANCPYIAQIVNLKADNGNNYAILKLLYTFDEAGVLKNYNGTIPSDNAQLTVLPADEILNLFNTDSPIMLGNVAQTESVFRIDLDAFTKGFLICSNNVFATGKLLANIFPQIIKRNKKVILLDTTGDYYSEQSFTFGKNFKLPLNSEFLDYIFDNDLEGVEPVSKAVIQDIFSEVKEYLQSIPQGYLPIDLLINVVQQQYNETRIPELVLLKNKLISYMENNIFASGSDDVTMLRSKVAHTDSLVVDISQADNKLIRKLIEFVYDTVTTVDADMCIFTTVNNDIADKKVLRKTLEFGNIFTTLICAHEFKYLPDLKQIMPNMLLFAPQTTQHDFAGYNTFLNKLNSDEFIVYGEFTQNIPFIVQTVSYDEYIHDDDIKKESTIIKTTAKDMKAGVLPEEDVEAEAKVISEEIGSDIENISEPEIMEEVPAVEEIIKDEPLEELSTVSDIVFEDDGEVIAYDEKEKLAEDDISFENDVLSDRELLEEQVANDVDASLYKKVDEENLDDEDKVNPEVLTESDNITDEDLDYIETLSSSDEEQTAEQDDNIDIVEKSEGNTVDVVNDYEMADGMMDELAEDEKAADEENHYIPIYTPDEFSQEDIAEKEENSVPLFRTGDVISHPKYGNGVVEKMINYGNKTLCSINFVNLGRRLLDPAISDLQLVGSDGAIAE